MNRNRRKLATNVPLFFVYTGLNHFILDRAIWMLFLQAKGFSLAQIALIESAYHAVNFLFEVPTGYVADRYGKRASLLVSQLAALLSSGMLLWGGHPAVVIIGFMLGALVGTFQSGAMSALVYETLQQLGREAHFKRYTSLLSGVTLSALGASGIVGGVLSDVDWGWVYFGKIVLSALTLLVVLYVTEPYPEAVVSAESPAAPPAYSFFGQLRVAYEFAKANKAFRALSVYGAILYSMSWSIAFYSQVIFRDTGLANKAIGLLNGLETWMSAAVASIAFLGERRLGRKGSILIAGIGYLLALAAFSTSTVHAQVIGAYFLMALVISYVEPLMEAYLNELLPSSIRATMLSVFSMLVSAGMMVTFTTIGTIADSAGLPVALKVVLVVWAPLCLLATGLALKTDYAKKP